MNQSRINRLKRLLVGGMGALSLYAMLMLATAGSAYAGGEFDFCYGVTISGKGTKCSAYPKGTYIQAIYGVGNDHSVCVGVDAGGGVKMCSAGAGKSVLNESFGKGFGIPYIENNAAGSNKVYGHVWYVDPPPPPPPSSPPPPPTPTARPAVVDDDVNGITSVWRGSNGHLYESLVSGGKWTTFAPTWGNLPAGVTVASDPSVVDDDVNGITSVWRGSNGHLYETVASGGKWTTFEPTWGNLPAGVTVTGNPSIVDDDVNGITALWRGSNGHLYATVVSGGKWTTFAPTWGNLPAGVTVSGDPAVVDDDVNGITALWRGSNGHLYETVASGGKWTTFEPTWGNLPAGVTVASDPAAVDDDVNGITALWRGSNGHLYETVASGGTWTTFEPTWGNLPAGVTVTGDPSVVDEDVNGVTVLWRGSDGNLFETLATNGVWNTFSPTWGNLPTGVSVTGYPSVVDDNVNGITSVWRGSNGRLFETVAPSGTWTTFEQTWGWESGGVTVAE